MNILKASEESKKIKAMVLITSDKVYKNIETNRGYKENDILMGNDPYSASKKLCRINNQYVFKFYADKKSKNMCY